MRVLLLRHADAGDRDPNRWPDDTLRPLTARGRRRQRRAARWILRRGLVATRLFSSPWVRAWETALILTERGAGPTPVAVPALAASPDLAAIEAALGRLTGRAVVHLVGHEPWLGQLAAILLTGRADGLAIDFPKSGILGLELDRLAPGQARLECFWRPRSE
jgi:phosphohistidine phosphatase